MKAIRRFVLGASVVAAASFSSPSPAAAADATSLGLANKGSLAVSADRLFGANFWSWTAKVDAGGRTFETKRSYSKFGLLWGDPASDPTGGYLNPYAIPRASIDFLVIDNLSIGGSIGLLSGSSRRTDVDPGTGISQERDGPTVFEFAFAPRVGYVLGFSSMAGLWLRGGFTYWTASSKTVDNTNPNNTDTNGFNGFSLNLEPTLVLAPIDHFGFTIGLVGDIPLTGKAKTERVRGGTTTITENDYKVMNFGLMVGLLGWF